MMQCVRVGHGTIAPLHERKLKRNSCKTAGVVEIDPKRAHSARAEGLKVYGSVEEAARLKPDFWDICVGTSQHLEVIERILEIDPRARIIVEKPVCLHGQLPQLERILERFQGLLCVNENYLGSKITKLVSKTAFAELGLKTTKLAVEMTKNRERDFARGRFVDEEGGALKYEGSHMLAILYEILGDGCWPHQIDSAKCIDAIVQRRIRSSELLPRQGSADIQYVTRSGLEVDFYTSMTGKTKHRYPPFSVDDIPAGCEVRHRLVAIEGYDAYENKYDVVGFYEPVSAFHRSYGAMVVLKNDRICKVSAPLRDDTMGESLHEIVRYFQGKRDNPRPVASAIEITKALHQLGKALQPAPPSRSASRESARASLRPWTRWDEDSEVLFDLENQLVRK